MSLDTNPSVGGLFVRREIEAKISASRQDWAQDWASLGDLLKDAASRLGEAVVPTPLRYVSHGDVKVKIEVKSDGTLTLAMSTVVDFEPIAAVSA